MLNKRLLTVAGLLLIALLGFVAISSAQSAMSPTGDKSQKVSSSVPLKTPSVSLSEQELSSGIVEVESFGAEGDGVTDDTKAIQTALNYAGQNKLSVHCKKGKTYLVSSVRIKNGIKKFLCEGTLKGKGKAAHGILELDGANVFKGVPVQDCVISATIDMSAGDWVAIFADAATKCIFENNYISGFTDDGNKTGILLWKDSNNNIIRNNKIIGTFKPKNSQHLIKLIGESLPWGNYFDGKGAFARATRPISGNTISNNFCQNGSHGIVLNSGERNTINNNRLERQRARSIALDQSSWYNNVTSNTCLEYGSSAIILSYGCGYNVIANNICRTGASFFPLGGEASINCYVGNEGNKIQGNIIDAPKNYGIYIAINGIANVVENNEIKNYLLAGIALESDWIRPLNPLAVYARPNFGASHTGRWAYGNTERNIIRNNIIDAPYRPGGCAIYLAQLGSSSLNNNTITGNTILDSANFKHYLYVFEESNGKLNGNVLTSNRFNGARASQFYMSRAKGHFSVQKNNVMLTDVK